MAEVPTGLAFVRSRFRRNAGLRVIAEVRAPISIEDKNEVVAINSRMPEQNVDSSHQT